MADTLPIGDGWIPAGVAGSVVTAPFPLNRDAAEGFLIDLKNTTSFSITSTTTDANGLVLTVTVTGSPSSTGQFCLGLSATSTAKFSNFSAAESAFVTGDQIQFVPDDATGGGPEFMRSSAFNSIKLLTVKSCSPIYKYQLIVDQSSEWRVGGGSGTTIIEDASLIGAANAAISINQTGTESNSTLIFRRCRFQNTSIGPAGNANNVLTLEHCILHEFVGQSTLISGGGLVSNVLNVNQCTIETALVGDSNPLQLGTINLNNTVLLRDGGFAGTVNGDFNWATFTNASLPGDSSVTDQLTSSAKFAITETKIGGQPTGPLYAYFPIDSTSTLDTQSAPTIAGIGTRDFYGNLIPTTGDQTIGCINLQTHDSGVAWGTYQAATTTTPAAVTIDSVTSGNAQTTTNYSGGVAGVTYELFVFDNTGIPVSKGTLLATSGSIVAAGLSNGISHGHFILPQESDGGFGDPSNTVFSTPSDPAAFTAASGQIPSIVDKVRAFYEGNADLLTWIQTYNAGETQAGHVHLGYNPTNLQSLITDGPQVLVSLSGWNVTNAGQNTSFNGTIEIIVNHIWDESDESADRHFNAINNLAAIEFDLLNLDPFQATFGGPVISSDTDISPFGDDDRTNVATTTITLDYGPGGA